MSITTFFAEFSHLVDHISFVAYLLQSMNVVLQVTVHNILAKFCLLIDFSNFAAQIEYYLLQSMKATRHSHRLSPREE